MPIVRRHMSAHALHSTVPVWEYVHSSLWSIIDRCLYCCWTVLLVVHPPYEQSTSGGLHCVCLCSGSFSCSWPVVEVHGEYRWSSYWWTLTGITFMFRDIRCLDGAAAAAAAVLLLNALYGIKERLLWAHRIELTCRTPWVSPGGCGSSLISAPVCVCKGFFNPWKPAETSPHCCFFFNPRCSPIWWNCRSGTVYKSDVRSTPRLLHQSWCHDSEGPRLPRCHREITLARMNRFNSNGSSALFMHSQTLTSLKLDFQSRGAETRGGGGCDVIMKVMKS